MAEAKLFGALERLHTLTADDGHRSEIDGQAAEVDQLATDVDQLGGDSQAVRAEVRQRRAARSTMARRWGDR